jgi:histidine triad (HIT) family protein
MENCLFCKIGSGEIPAEKVLESQNFVVFKDIKPQVVGHSLVIPKQHFQTVLDLPNPLASEFLDITKNASMKLLAENKASAFNLIVNSGTFAGQVVPHFHMHILPRIKQGGVEIK